MGTRGNVKTRLVVDIKGPPSYPKQLFALLLLSSLEACEKKKSPSLSVRCTLSVSSAVVPAHCVRARRCHWEEIRVSQPDGFNVTGGLREPGILKI